ncbi:hypothetical protein FJ420_04235 [Mesorhizobium sp. B3-1-3]|uniref:hypothetical protein n=1 Tax=unclassified Mesorhizobium TaxID=325217 RepID=UPI00112E6051|nr:MULTISPECIES: hypothetical protein [unclassified Mesorhizobium]TPI69004.1 hypothetical protein FJ424_06320 [Mesorhizobium sp. B3-1-8]TPI74772.1 hypothetical protein FJ420_04235 [Mesorhizobium sp. B3-1-3]TPL49580.1 hypothetical protein FJ957_10890 [Mesorhizobium sp. B2-4-6]
MLIVWKDFWIAWHRDPFRSDALPVGEKRLEPGAMVGRNVQQAGSFVKRGLAVDRPSGLNDSRATPWHRAFKGTSRNSTGRSATQRRSEMLDESRIDPTNCDFRGRPLARVRFAANQR